MSDVDCPYCEKGQEINHDDGYGYDEDREHEQHCSACNKEFKFTTSISFSYDVFCSGDHELEPNEPPHSDLWDCKNCDYHEVRR